jgi:putative spermidine/putrescine transport system ATP-binding protein
MAFLEIIDLCKTFANFKAVDRFNLKVQKGEFISFLGPSGCGKTTTLRMVAGFESPSSGQILIDDQDVTYAPPNRRNIGMVFQSYALFPNMTVADNIGFGLKVAKRSKEEILQREEEMLRLIHMEAFAKRYPYQLSGGQQQRVALARALAIRPQVLLLDEPLSALDAKIRVELRNEIRSIQQKLGITTIYVTHDQEEALSLSDRVVVMKDGRMEQVGTPFEIYNFPHTPFVASFVGTLNVINAVVRNAEQGVLEVDGQVIQTRRTIPENEQKTISLALRPETISLTEHSNGSVANRLNGQIETVAFLGSIVRIRMKMAQNSLFFDMFNDPHLSLPTPGEQASIFFSPEACLILNEDGAPKNA